MKRMNKMERIKWNTPEEVNQKTMVGDTEVDVHTLAVKKMVDIGYENAYDWKSHPSVRVVLSPEDHGIPGKGDIEVYLNKDVNFTERTAKWGFRRAKTFPARFKEEKKPARRTTKAENNG